MKTVKQVSLVAVWLTVLALGTWAFFVAVRMRTTIVDINAMMQTGSLSTTPSYLYQVGAVALIISVSLACAALWPKAQRSEQVDSSD